LTSTTTTNANIGVYALTNRITKKSYVGSSKDLSNRKASHFWQMRTRRHKNWHIQSDFDAHGGDSFQFDILDYAALSDLRAIEQAYIDSGDFAYNIAKKAAGGGSPVTDAKRRKMSKAHMGKKHTPETVAKLKARPAETSGSFTGYYHTPTGVFASSYEAEAGMSGVLNFTTIRRWCANPDKPFCAQAFRKSAYLQSLGEGVILQTPRSLGFGFEQASAPTAIAA
jgi:group I intron endonuclease